MSDYEQIHISLPAETIQFLQARVAAGEYRTVSDAILEGIGFLQSHADAGSDEWIQSEVLPALREYDAEPNCGLTPAQMRCVLAADAE